MRVAAEFIATLVSDGLILVYYNYESVNYDMAHLLWYNDNNHTS